jgi:hypothetical protein
MRSKLQFILFAIIATLLFSGGAILSSDVLGLNITNATVITRVNVTNTEPVLYLVRVLNTPIDLTAGTATVVVCNGSFSDVNGYTDIKNVSATLYRDTVVSSSPDDNNTHYTNSSCLTSCSADPGTNNQNGSCLCNFPVQYYAQNGSWVCNLTIQDSGFINRSLNSSTFAINEVIGIDVENDVLDYGNLSATQTSPPIRENVINTGNIPINVTVRGYGGGDETVGENYTMLCEAGVNLTFGYQRYSQYNDTAFENMFNLTNQTRPFVNLTIPKRTENAGYGNSSNSTWWRLQIPLGPAGVCNGTIVFGARRWDY